MEKNAKFITFEGGEGAGKSTQIKLLSEYLESKNIPHLLTREPGGTVAAEEIRQLIVTGEVGRWNDITETMLLMAARCEHLVDKIIPAIDDGKWVLCDRFLDSTVAYQAVGKNLGVSWVNDLYDLMCKKIGSKITPDISFIFDIPPEIGIGRAKSRGDIENRFENMDIEYHHKLRTAFLDIARENTQRCKLINAADEIGNIHKNIISNIGSI